MRQQPLRIACIGEVMVELVSEDSKTARIGFAGDTYNTAFYLARLLSREQAEITYITALGTDRFSDRIIRQMHAHGIATDHIERRPEKIPGLYSVETDAAGERNFTYWRSDSAARSLFSLPAEVSLDQLSTFDVIYLSGITMAVLPPEIRTALINAIDVFRVAGGRFVYDSNHRPKLWESLDVAREINGALWRRADIALPSLDDEMACFGDESELSVLERLRNYGCRDGALKRGHLGPTAIAVGVDLQAFAPALDVIDTTAAGDSFNAGYLAARLVGASVSEALQNAHSIANKVIGAKGAIVPI